MHQLLFSFLEALRHSQGASAYILSNTTTAGERGAKCTGRLLFLKTIECYCFTSVSD